MVVFNGSPQQDIWSNRAFLFGDAVFETLKVAGGRVLFLEDHYFRLMSSMRILRMEIPMAFTMEFFEEQALLAAQINDCPLLARVRFTVFRDGGGRYFPASQMVNWHILAEPLESAAYPVVEGYCEMDLYKDFAVSAQLLSTLKTTNKMVHILAGIYAKENGLDNCLLINESKNVVEAINGNIFLIADGQLVTPPVTQGCLSGIMRKQIIELAKKSGELTVNERPVSPFEIQKADELWVTNVISGIVPVTLYRKKKFETHQAARMTAMLNQSLGF